MNRKQKAQWLAAYYTQVAEGGEMVTNVHMGWSDRKGGPNMKSDEDTWRIKSDPDEILQDCNVASGLGLV